MIIIDKYKQLLQVYRIPLYYCGIELFDSDYHFNFRTLIINITCILYYICALNTILAWPLMSTLEMLSACGIGVTGTIKLFTIMVYHKELNEMFMEMENLCEQVSSAGRLSRRYQICVKYINLCRLINKVYHCIGTLCCLVVCAYPGVMYFFTKDVVFAFSCYIPFMDPFTSIGYTVTMVFHSVCLVLVYNTTVGIDAMFFFAVIQCTVLVELFQVGVDELNKILSSNETDDQIRSKLKVIVQEHQSICSAVRRLGHIFYWPIAVQIGLSIVSLAVSLFMAITTTWYVSYATCIASLVQLLIFSLFGTIIETKSEELEAYVNDVLWYLLPQKAKKRFQILLMNAQKTKSIGIAGLAILNVNTCVSILKTVYSYLMMLLSV